MTALARYARKRTLTHFKYALPKRARVAYTAAKYMYRHRRKFIGYAKKFKKFQGRTKWAKRGVPGVRNMSKAKQAPLFAGVGLSIGYRRLNLLQFEWPSHSTDNDIGTRSRNAIKLKGIKLCRQFYNDTPSNNNSIYRVHWALIQFTGKNTFPAAADIKPSFFRTNASTTSRSEDFVDMQDGDSFEAKYNCQPMNPNNQYKILTRRHWKITAQDNNQPNMNSGKIMIEKYIKFNKNFTFDNRTDVNPRYPICEVFWLHAEDPLSHTNSVPHLAFDFVKTWSNHTMYFSESECC